MVTSRLVSGGKQESGATVGVNWRCSGEPSGLGGGDGTGGDGRTVVAQGKNQSWMSGVRIWPRTEETGMSTSTSQVLLRHPLRAF